MIRKVRVKNYKSIPNLELELGRVTVLIGANGSGKSNILEAFALASASAQYKLDNEFLISRGIRVTETRFMQSAFVEATARSEKIQISVQGDNNIAFACGLSTDETVTYPRWKQDPALTIQAFFDYLAKYKKDLAPHVTPKFLEEWLPTRPDILERAFSETSGSLRGFLLFAPENSALRPFQSEGQILPLGIRGEGLFAHLKALDTEKNRSRLVKIKESLALIEWFDTFEVPKDLAPGERSIRIHDRFLPENVLFDQRSANEGFLFLLFYITLMISPDTPAFFAIDNIDTSLNPKLCVALLQQIVKLAKEHDKQVIITTHNPAVLDGLNLNDDEQRLLVVERNKDGHTRVHRVDAPKATPGKTPVSLSEAFLRGYIGGLPKNF